MENPESRHCREEAGQDQFIIGPVSGDNHQGPVNSALSQLLKNSTRFNEVSIRFPLANRKQTLKQQILALQRVILTCSLSRRAS